MAGVDRRKFMAWVGGAGASLGLGSLFGRAAQAARVSTFGASEAKSLSPTYPPRALPRPGDKIHEFDIDVSIQIHEILPKVKIPAFTYNKTLPGPEIRVTEGDWVQVNFTNRTSEFHTIHWHGIQLACEMDGVPFGTQWPVGKDQTFRYLFRAQPAGTHFYHCHNMTPLHIQAGMYGALIIEPKNDPIRARYNYKRDYTLALSEVDTVQVETQMEEMLRMMGLMDRMGQNPTTMAEMNGRMMGWFKDKKAFQKAISEGYIPPYATARTGPARAHQFDYFLINGKSFPMTEPLWIRTGESIRVRLIGAGALPHFMHLHGHDFWHVCQDGAPLAQPIRMNTVPVFPGTTSDIIIEGTNPGMWHFHDHSDISNTNNGQFPGGMMTMLMYEDMEQAHVRVPDVIQVGS